MNSTVIAGIPAGIVNNHNEVLYYWVKSGIKGATLFRVDAHHDMCDCYHECNINLLKQMAPSDCYRFCSSNDIYIANFNCPAVHQGIVDSIYWHNPHSVIHKLQDLGTTKEEVGRRKIGVIILDPPKNSLSKSVCCWDESVRKDLINGRGEIIHSEMAVPADGRLIVDFDLDGFCCNRSWTIDFLPENIPPRGCMSDFEKRIDESIALLKLLPRPNLVTIARSLGDTKSDTDGGCYVPHKMVNQVQECLIEKLKQLY